MDRKYKVPANSSTKAMLEEARGKGLMLGNMLMAPFIRDEEYVITESQLDEIEMEFHTRMARAKKHFEKQVAYIRKGK